MKNVRMMVVMIAAGFMGSVMAGDVDLARGTYSAGIDFICDNQGLTQFPVSILNLKTGFIPLPGNERMHANRYYSCISLVGNFIKELPKEILELRHLEFLKLYLQGNLLFDEEKVGKRIVEKNIKTVIELVKKGALVRVLTEEIRDICFPRNIKVIKNPCISIILSLKSYESIKLFLEKQRRQLRTNKEKESEKEEKLISHYPQSKYCSSA